MAERTEKPAPFVLQMHAARLEILQAENQVNALIAGELDAAAAPLARDALMKCSGSGVGLLDLDMSGITFIDSKGLALLLALKRHSQQGGYDIRLVSPSRAVKEALDLVGLTASFEIHRP